MTMSPEDRWDDHIATDRKWRIVFLWVIGILGIIVAIIATVAVIAAVRAYENTKDLERANCRIIRIVDAGVVSEEQAIVTGERALSVTTEPRLKIIRQRSLNRHITNRNRGKAFAKGLREDVNCPPKNGG